MAHFSLLERCKLFVVLYATVNGLYKITAEAGRVNELSCQTVLITMRKYISFNIVNMGHAHSLKCLTSHTNSAMYTAL